MNNKGMTVIELVVSFVLTIVIALFLIEIVFFLKDIYVTNGIKSEIILKQSLISDRINKIFNSKRISNISNCGDDCISVMFNDSSVETISFDKKSNKVIIGDYVNSLPNGSVIGETVMKTTVNDTEINCFNSLFQIYVPITNVLVKNKVFDINIVYQYDNRKENWSYNNPNKNTMVKEFVYTGNYQTFVAPYTGWYKIELWGAQGVFGISKGAYVSGKLHLNKNEVMYVYVGEGNNATANGIASFNGGVGSAGGSPGGGATDIRLVNGNWNNIDSLKSRIIVAGGSGSGQGNNNMILGAGGTLNGNNGGMYDNVIATGGTQMSAGIVNCCGLLSKFGEGNSGCAGGGGYYGGGGGSCIIGSGGGSSFISGYAGVNAVTASSSLTHSNNTIHYSSKYFIDGAMEAGVNVGHGKAKITLIEEPKKINLSLNKVRYIKDCINGSNINTFNHWIELQAIKNGVNVAKDKNVIGSVSANNGFYPYSIAVDGDITVSKYAVSNQSNSCITVDLGQVYDLDEIAVWHYYADGRTYNNNITSVSTNNTDWITVINKTEPETPNGKRVSAYSN